MSKMERLGSIVEDSDIQLCPRELEAAWKQASGLGDELGVSAENLAALICGIGDKFLEREEAQARIITELRDALKPVWSLCIYGGGLTQDEIAAGFRVYEASAKERSAPKGAEYSGGSGRGE